MHQSSAEPADRPASATDAAVIYSVAFVTGAIVMGFEMLGSRYLNPYFGSGIYTWASLISTVLFALTAGYFLGGNLADRAPSPAVLAATVLAGSIYLVALPSFAQPVLELVLRSIDDIRAGSLISSFALMSFPVTMLGMYSPFAIRLLLRSARHSGRVSGAVYGISTAGSIVGTLGTTFFLIPVMGSRNITLTLGALGLLSGLALLTLTRLGRRHSAALVAVALTALAMPDCRAHELIDEGVRASLLKRANGRIAHIETEYNDIFITKRQNQLVMSFQIKGWDYTESVANLLDVDDLPLRYAQVMTIAIVYPQTPRRILMLGLGGGSISTYLGRFVPEATITTVEIDPGVITAAKTYFGLRETERMRYHAGDGRVFLTRNSEPYDLILLDAYRGGYVPFHLLTREFYSLVKQRLTPGGAAAFNVHDGTKLYVSTMRTLGEVFPALDLYPTGLGETIAVATSSPLDKRDPGAQGDAPATPPRLPICAAANSATAHGQAPIAGCKRRCHHRRFRPGRCLRRDRQGPAQAQVSLRGAVSASPRGAENFDYGRITPLPGVSECTDTIPVGNVDVGPGLHEQAHDLGMVGTAVTQHHRFHERCPAEIVDMIPIDPGGKQHLHRLDVAAVAGRDEGGSAEPIEAIEIGIRQQHQLEDVGSAFCSGNQKRGVLNEIPGIDVGAFGDQQTGHVDVIALRRSQQGGAATAVAEIDANPFGQQPTDHQKLAALGGRHQRVLGRCRLAQSK